MPRVAFFVSSEQMVGLTRADHIRRVAAKNGYRVDHVVSLGDTLNCGGEFQAVTAEAEPLRFKMPELYDYLLN